jgi:steroid delta-isomerase-like uncharacterized protein
MNARPVAVTADPTDRQRVLVDAHLAAENRHDWAAVTAGFDGTSPEFEIVPAGVRLHGIDGVETAYRMLSTALPDLSMAVRRGVDAPGCSVREVRMTGTHLGEYFGMPPSGRRIGIDMACFFEFDADGRLRCERIYFDNGALLRQMASAADAPEAH